MTKPSETFERCLKASVTKYFHKEFIPCAYLEQETGAWILDEDQNVYNAKMEQWILDNKEFLVKFLKAKAAEELNKAQLNFNFTKEL